MSFGKTACIACDKKHLAPVGMVACQSGLSDTQADCEPIYQCSKTIFASMVGLGFSRQSIFEKLKDLAKNSAMAPLACRLSRRPQSSGSHFWRVADHTSRIGTSTATLQLPCTLTADDQLKMMTQYFHSLPCG